MTFLDWLKNLFRRPDPPVSGGEIRITSNRPANMATTDKPIVTKTGLDLIKHFESCLKPTGRGTFRAYPDPAHGWKVATIGWGTIQYPNGEKVRRGDEITQERADELLAWEVGEKAEGVRRLVTVGLDDHQFSALVSFAYNLGLGNLKRSTLLKKVNRGDFDGAATEFIRWNRAGGKVLDGLTRRRMSEERLWRGEIDPIVTMREFKAWKG